MSSLWNLLWLVHVVFVVSWLVVKIPETNRWFSRAYGDRKCRCGHEIRYSWSLYMELLGSSECGHCGTIFPEPHFPGDA